MATSAKLTSPLPRAEPPPSALAQAGLLGAAGGILVTPHGRGLYWFPKSGRNRMRNVTITHVDALRRDTPFRRRSWFRVMLAGVDRSRRAWTRARQRSGTPRTAPRTPAPSSSAPFGRQKRSRLLMRAPAHQRKHCRYPRPYVMKPDDACRQIQKPVTKADSPLPRRR
jgi:hypothetical protein